MTWRPPQPAGYLDSIQTVGGIAAPLLAGASFTLAVLALQTPAPPATAFSRWPDAALACFVLAGFAQIGTVQATAWTRRYMCTPDDLTQWYPGQIVDGQPTTWLRGFQESHLRQAMRWAQAARLFFHTGVLGLLFGLTAVCVPPAKIGAGRWVVLTVCAAAVIGEFAWLIRAVFLSTALRRRAWRQGLALLAVAGSVGSSGLRFLSAIMAVLLLGLAVALVRSAREQQAMWLRSFRGVATAGAVLAAVTLLADGPRLLVGVALVPAVLHASLLLVGLARAQNDLRS